MRIYLDVVRFNFFKFFSYPFEILGYLGKRLGSLGFLILFWSVVAASSHNSLKIDSIVGYFLIATSLATIVLSDTLPFGEFLSTTIRMGDLNNYLIKPLGVIPYLYATYIGQMGLSFVFSLITLCIGVLLSPHHSFLSFLVFLLFSFFAVLISLSFNIIIGVISFYTTESRSIKNVFLHVNRLLSGLLIPLSLFPKGIKQIVLLTPFPSIVSNPVLALQSSHVTAEIMHNLFIAFFWACAMLFFSFSLWSLALKKYEAIGI